MTVRCVSTILGPMGFALNLQLLNSPTVSTSSPPVPLRPVSPPCNILRRERAVSIPRIRDGLQLYRVRYSRSFVEDGDEEGDGGFDEAVQLFNQRDYYKCHDSLEALWINSEEPRRTLVHGILQCAVGFHHLFNRNHKGAMMELGEGLCKLRKMDFESGPFLRFEQEIAAVLEFVYQTQIELAACSDDMCLTMDGSDRSYQLLGGYGAGQSLYSLQRFSSPDGTGESLYIVFTPNASSSSSNQQKVKLPIFDATEEHLLSLT